MRRAPSRPASGESVDQPSEPRLLGRQLALIGDALGRRDSSWRLSVPTKPMPQHGAARIYEH
jgi:hypothetical protein